MKRDKIRKSLALMTAIILSFSLVACGSEDSYKNDDVKDYINNYPHNNENIAGEAGEEYNRLTDNNENIAGEAGEEYNRLTENGFVSATEQPLSTFSIDVDTASYTNIRRMLMNEQEINSDAVRIEEFINYFSYDYDEPEGDTPFEVNLEYSNCPWNSEAKLVSIGLQAEKIDLENRAPMNVVFLIDVSGSMYSENKLPLVQSSFNLLAENLKEGDRVSIVTYAGSDEVVLEGADGKDYTTISDALYSLSAGGSTAGAKGINTAYEIAQEYFIKGGNNRVILATDGDLNVGVSSESGLTTLIEQKRESGIYLSVLGFGYGNYKDNKLEALADNGNGNYAYIDSEFEAKRVLVEEMGGTLYTVAKDVKIQVEFNQDCVESYRLVGYENRLLDNEDFTDDTKDAGEIGSGHTVTALYEIIPTPQTNGVLVNVGIRYKEPDSDTSTQYDASISADEFAANPSDNFVFASNVAGLAMILKNSDYIFDYSLSSVEGALSEIDFNGDLYKEELYDVLLPLLKDYFNN